MPALIPTTDASPVRLRQAVTPIDAAAQGCRFSHRLCERSLGCAIAMLAAAAMLTGCSRGQSASELLQEAQRHLDQGDPKAAIIQYKNSLQKDPENAAARYRLGLVYNQLGDAVSAEKELRKASELELDPVKVLPALASALMRQGQFDKVLREVPLAALGARGTEPEVLVARANAHTALGQVKEARELLDAALDRRPDLEDALVGKARLAAIEHDYDAALILVERALEQNLEQEEGWMLKGDLKRLKGDNEGALSAYSQVSKANAYNLAARLNKTSLLIAAGKFDEAQAEIDAAKKGQPGQLIIFYSQALLDFRRGNFAAANESLQTVLKAAPDHLPSVLLAATVQQATGSFEQAERNLRFFLGKAHTNLYARKMLVATLLRSKQAAQARKELEPALARAPEDPQVLALAGEAYMQTGEFVKAAEFLEKASNIEPNSASLRTGLGLSRLAAGETERAIADLETAVKLDATNFKPDSLLVMSHISRKKFDQALKALDDLEKKKPNNPFVLNLRGAAYLGKNNREVARENFERALALDPQYFPASANLAQLDIADKKPQAARKRFEVILTKDPKNLRALLALAGLATATGGRQQALDWLERAKETNPEAVQPYLALIQYHLDGRDAKRAVQLGLEAVNKHLESAEALDALGRAYLANASPNEAASVFGKLVKLRPSSALSHYRLATAQQAANSGSGAEASLKKALQLKPNYLDAQAALAAIQGRAGRFDEAMSLARDMQQQLPKSPVGHVIAGDLLLAQNKPKDAADAYEAGYRVARNGAIAIKLSAALDQAGKGLEGESRLLDYLKDNPQDLGASLFLADQYLKNKEYRKATQQYLAILKAAPQNVVALNNLAWASHQLKDDKALDYAEQAYKLRPDSAAVVYTLGKLLVDHGKYQRGVELLQAAVAKAPNVPEIRYHLVEALIKSGSKAKAREELERLLANGKKFPEAAEAAALLKQLGN